MIFSEIDEPLDFNETLANNCVINIIPMNNVRFLRKTLFKKLSALRVIYLVCNGEENKTLIVHIYCMLRKTFKEKQIYLT